MSATQTSKMLGRVLIEEVLHQGLEQSEVGPRDVREFRPMGTPVRNDGVWHYWMAEGEVYRIAHDGVGWRVTCQSWDPRHVRRLVESQDMQIIGSLPLQAGTLGLEVGRTYELREPVPQQGWSLYLI